MLFFGFRYTLFTKLLNDSVGYRDFTYYIYISKRSNKKNENKINFL